MASTSSNQPGIVTWVSSIRTTMANDPGRQLLEDQIQTNGFLFLEDYLESILAKPKPDPIIELVKTPARRRNGPKKIRCATAAALKARPHVTMDLEEVNSDKENEAPLVTATPINAFHKALLQAKGSSLSSESAMLNEPSNGSNPIVTTSIPLSAREEEEEKVVENMVTPPHQRFLPPQNHEAGPPKPAAFAVPADHPQDPPHPELAAELSTIAEDDELIEFSRYSMAKQPAEIVEPKRESGTSSLKIGRSPKPYPKKTPPAIDMATIMDIDDFTQTTNFNVMLASDQSTRPGHLDGVATAPASTERASSVQSVKSRQSTPHDVDYSTAPLPSDEPHAEMPLENQVTEKGTAGKSDVSEYPTIGPPSPFRKSIRVPKEALPATKHALPPTTRSSWLVKAREAKAMEDGAKKPIPRSILPDLAAGSKRKSGDMLGIERDGIGHEDTRRTQKLTKITEASPVLRMLKEQEGRLFGHFRDETIAIVDDGLREHGADSDGMMDKLKKTVAGFSARAGRSMGKSLGGAAAAALAEARAAAEAKIAERNATEGRVLPVPVPVAPVSPGTNQPDRPEPTSTSNLPSEQQQETAKRDSNEKNRQLSVSDLFSKFDARNKEVERVFQPPPLEGSKAVVATASNGNVNANTSTSTTPPNSPPKTRPPIFTLPEKPKLSTVPTFFTPSTSTLPRFESQPFAPPRIPQPLSSHSTLFSTQSTYTDAIFDDEMPAWVPSTQDTDLSDHGLTQGSLPKTSNRDVTEPETDMDADESWHLDEKFGETWSPVAIGMKDDSMTWSTAPTRSTRSADTGHLDASLPPAPSKSSPVEELLGERDTAFEAIPSDNPPCSTADEIDDEDMDVELDEDIASVRLVTPAPQSKNERFSARTDRDQFQEETLASSNTNGGFFSSASKLVSSVLGGSKKGKEPVKSLQLAAAAAKKQQEEAEKKANRLKEMEARRQQVLQKKAEEDRAREERRAKEEAERWKREKEKEDITEKRTLKQPGKKLTQLEDELAKKGKLAEPEKKVELKKPLSKDKKDAPTTRIGKLIPTTSQPRANASVLPSKTVRQTTTTATTQNTSMELANTLGDVKFALASKAKEKTKETEVTTKQLVQSQMQARYQAQLDDSRNIQKPEVAVSTEPIELPDINSEYSDSDDENRVRTFDPPGWAQSPELREALQSQSTVNPDDIFGAIRPLKMEELFKNRTSRFRARTSSANWAGTDELTVHEEREYARRMGYRK